MVTWGSLDRWRSARQLRNTRLARKAAQETARNTRPPEQGQAVYNSYEAQGAYNLGWSQGWTAGYQAAMADVANQVKQQRQGKATP